VRTTEKIFIVFAVMGEFMHMFHLPFAEFVLVLSLGLLGIFYFALGWLLFRERRTRANNLSLSIIAGLVCSIAVTGMLFKLMYWPGSRLLLFSGFAFIAILIIPYYVQLNRNADPELGMHRYYKNMLQRLMLTASIAAILLLVPTASLLRIKYRDQPERARLMERYLEDPNNEQYRQELIDYEEQQWNKIAE